ncbi:hypothetical protein M405DRAFT_858044 [Rhizopogon salebrosus TDB-379]|nr:hypothetical protein M405DRAFT_858044 [Rhizopogon salebrosus TDB-379]
MDSVLLFLQMLLPHPIFIVSMELSAREKMTHLMTSTDTGRLSSPTLRMFQEEAVDALHWSYTDPLWAYPQPAPPPFSQDECHKLLTHLNGSSSSPSQLRIPFISVADPSLTPTMHTRMIALHWRQMHFRPYKPLPHDTFLSVNLWRALDLESGMASSTGGSMFLAGACACLVAAVIVSASVMLMTLPGLNVVARIAGLVAIMCSVLSMITSFIAIIRYKAELTHGTPTSGAEGFVLLSRRIVLLSLPLVFLAYSVAGFITGVVIYSFNGAMINATAGGLPVMNKFDDWCRLFAVGVLGGVAGVLIASVVVQRR